MEKKQATLHEVPVQEGGSRSRSPRRFSLNRETILVLNDPELLGRARGGWPSCDSHSITNPLESNNGC